MSKKTITITVKNAEGDLVVDPGYAHLRVDDEITWSAPDASSLLITLRDGTAVGLEPPAPAGGLSPGPLAPELLDALARRVAPRHGVVELRAQAKAGGKGAAVKAFARKPGMFGYQLALVVDGKVYADASCPEIIIE